MSFLNRFRQKKVEDEESRLSRLLRTGRIGEGVILDISDDPSDAPQISYTYSIGGVDYESVQVLSEEQRAQVSNYSPGGRVVIRYDPHRPGNSIVV
jgi:hypothetical protein